MNSQRKQKHKITLRIEGAKPRNPLVAAALVRKAGSHRKSEAATRQAHKHELRNMARKLRER